MGKKYPFILGKSGVIQRTVVAQLKSWEEIHQVIDGFGTNGAHLWAPTSVSTNLIDLAQWKCRMTLRRARL